MAREQQHTAVVGNSTGETVKVQIKLITKLGWIKMKQEETSKKLLK